MGHADEPEHAGLCYLAVARCQNSVGNSYAEAEALISASRSFLQAERKGKLIKGNFEKLSWLQILIIVQELHCPTFEEHLLSAVDSYNKAIKLMTETSQSSRAAGLCIELADALIKVIKFSRKLFN